MDARTPPLQSPHNPKPAGFWRLLIGGLGLSWAFHLSVWRGLYMFYGPEAAYYLDAPASSKAGVSVFLASLAFAVVLVGLAVRSQRDGT